MLGSSEEGVLLDISSRELGGDQLRCEDVGPSSILPQEERSYKSRFKKTKCFEE